MVLNSSDYVFKMSVFKKLSLCCTVYTGTCICNIFHILKDEKALRETQTLRARRSPHIDAESAMVVVRQSQNLPPPAEDPLHRGAGPPKFNQLDSWRWSLPAPTDPVW